LLSLFAAEEAADEEVEAGERGCDDEDYAHFDAGFGAGEDGLVLNRDFEAKRRLNDQEAPEHLSLVGEASPYIPKHLGPSIVGTSKNAAIWGILDIQVKNHHTSHQLSQNPQTIL
jgi:hypothetical protein